MKNFNYKFSLLFAKIVLPVLLTIFIFSSFIVEQASKEKKDMLFEKVLSLASMISSMATFDNNAKATLSQVQATFDMLQKRDTLLFEYLVAKKTDDHIEFIAYSSQKKPPSIKLSDKSFAIPMRNALKGYSGVEIGHDYHGQKVFSAYMDIPNTSWGLVLKQPYNEHVAPFKENLTYMIIIIIIVLIVLYYVLRFYELRNNKLIKNSEDRYRNLVESTHDWIWEVDANGVYTYTSDKIEDILGYKAEDIIGKTPFDFMNEEEAKLLSNKFAEIVESEAEIVNLENKSMHKDGSEVVFLTNGTPFFSITGELIGYRGIDRDITELKKKQNQVEQLAYFDMLTGLANRRTMSTRIDEEISYASRNNSTSALIYLDLDGFKYINDSLGHTHGDKVLSIVADRLKESIRDFDIAGRVGGDEFILLIRGKEKGSKRCKIQLNIIIDRILKNINEELDIDGEINHIGASLGVVFLPQDGKDADELIKHADSAMYKAKSLGRNRAVFYDIDLQNDADKLLSIKNDILNALKNNEFEMHYQAQYDCTSKNIVGYEALIRWKKKDKMVPPSEFLPYVDSLGLSLNLDKYVFNKVCNDIQNRDVFSDDKTVSINILAKSFEDEEFLVYIADRVKNVDIDVSKIILEITEDALIQNIDNENDFIQSVKNLGFMLSIDDFGTGYSSLSYLSSINFDEIKLDMAFVQAIQRSEKDAQICKLILNMCRELNVKVVAEGVETLEQLEFVKKEGANIIQGYLYARPKSLSEL